MELALETAPVGNIEQEIGIRGGLQLVDSLLRLRQLGPAAGESAGLALGRGSGAAAADAALLGCRRGCAPCRVARRRFYLAVLRLPVSEGARSLFLVFFFMTRLEGGLPGFTKTG